MKSEFFLLVLAVVIGLVVFNFVNKQFKLGL